MSAIYNLEPQPTASVILHTTLGELSVELFAKHTPLTSRNFLQLCVDGYYDGTIFHRLVPGFILQGGDPTGTGNGGECIYDGDALSGDLDPWPADQRHGKNAGPQGVNFRDEFHSRLKFNRRGLLGMANEGRPDTNGSQFFFTLDKAEELNGKNTLFGRVAGNTIYNLARIGEAEVAEGTERPLYPIKITHVEVLENPFEGMKKRMREVQPSAAPVEKKKSKKKPKAAKNLLSFGDEEGDEPVVPVPKKAKFDTRIVMDVDDEDIQPAVKPTARKEPKQKKGHGQEQESSKEERSEKEKEPRDVNTIEKPSRADEPAGKVKPRQAHPALPNEPNDEDANSPTPEPVAPKKSALEQANEEIAALKASMKRNIDAAPVAEVKKTGTEQFIPETSTRGRKRRRAGGNSSNADYSSFEAFKQKLQQLGPEKEAETPHVDTSEVGPDGPGDADEGEAELCDLHFIANCQSCKTWDKLEGEKEDSDDEGWMAHSLSFAADKLGKDLNYRKKAEDELVVIDPREKAQTLKEERLAKQEAKSGGSGREWDRARNEKLARQSALAGRGAR